MRATIVIVLVLAALAGGCATKAMREQAGVIATAGEQLERETAAFASARTGVVQLRQRSLVEQRAEVSATGQQNAATLAQWKVAGTEERAKRVALFQGITAASEAMYEVRDQSLLWEESVLASRTALAVDRAALHRFVLQLVRLSRPGRVLEGVKFYVEYGTQVGGKVESGLQEVLAGVAAAEAGPPTGSGVGGGSGPGSTPTRPGPGVPTLPVEPVDPKLPPRDPTKPVDLPVTPTDPGDPPRPDGPKDFKSGQRRAGAEGGPGEVRGR